MTKENDKDAKIRQLESRIAELETAEKEEDKADPEVEAEVEEDELSNYDGPVVRVDDEGKVEIRLQDGSWARIRTADLRVRGFLIDGDE